MSKSSEKIRDAFKHCEHVRLVDQEYAAPTADWLLNDWAEEWRQSTPVYHAAFDCDDIAFAYKLAVQNRHRYSGKKEDGFAVGVLFYNRDSGGGHAIVWALTEDVGLIFIEPQSGERVQLTDTEWESIYFVYA